MYLGTDVEVVLPTLEDASHMRFDCKSVTCQCVAEQWEKECGHTLIVCHQLLPSGKYQLIVRHTDLGEAVVILPAIDGLEADVEGYTPEMVSQWIEDVHAYLAGERSLLTGLET